MMWAQHYCDDQEGGGRECSKSTSWGGEGGGGGTSCAEVFQDFATSHKSVKTSSFSDLIFQVVHMHIT